MQRDRYWSVECREDSVTCSIKIRSHRRLWLLSFELERTKNLVPGAICVTFEIVCHFILCSVSFLIVVQIIFCHLDGVDLGRKRHRWFSNDGLLSATNTWATPAVLPVRGGYAAEALQLTCVCPQCRWCCCPAATYSYTNLSTMSSPLVMTISDRTYAFISL